MGRSGQYWTCITTAYQSGRVERVLLLQAQVFSPVGPAFPHLTFHCFLAFMSPWSQWSVLCLQAVLGTGIRGFWLREAGLTIEEIPQAQEKCSKDGGRPHARCPTSAQGRRHLQNSVLKPLCGSSLFLFSSKHVKSPICLHSSTSVISADVLLLQQEPILTPPFYLLKNAIVSTKCLLIVPLPLCLN